MTTNDTAASIPPPPLQVKAWRKVRGLTIEQLAELTGLSAPNLSQIENQRHGGSTRSLMLIADALNISFIDLYHVPGEEPLKVSPAVRSLLDIVRDLDDDQIEKLTETLRALVRTAPQSDE